MNYMYTTLPTLCWRCIYDNGEHPTSTRCWLLNSSGSPLADELHATCLLGKFAVDARACPRYIPDIELRQGSTNTITDDRVVCDVVLQYVHQTQDHLVWNAPRLHMLRVFRLVIGTTQMTRTLIAARLLAAMARTCSSSYTGSAYTLLDHAVSVNERAVGFVCTPRRSHVGYVRLGLPYADLTLQDLVLCRRLVDHV